MSHFIKREHIVVAVFSSFLLILTIGCNESSKKSEPEVKSIPKLTLHLPDTYSEGIERIRKLFDSAIANEELPGPICYQVLEVVHGKGMAAHSHYYRFEETDKQSIDNHGHETTDEFIHSVEVDLFTELADLAKWLPNIAIDGDMDEATWLKVKKVSSSLSDELDEKFKSNTDAESRRHALRKHSESLSNLIVQLEDLEPNTAKTPESE